MSQVKTLEKSIQTLNGDCVRVLHLTDSHIFSADKGKLLGLNTRTSFEAVLQRVVKEEFQPDFLLATGDLSQDSSDESYEYIRDKLGELPYPSFWIPGNHDQPKKMFRILESASVFTHKCILTSHWQIVLLDSSVPKKVHGFLDEEQLQFIESSINRYPDKHCLVVMHHQPVNVGSEWLDNIGLKNADKLFDIVKKHPMKKVFLWGHVHQEFDETRQKIRLLATPSTCVQFAQKSNDFSAGQESPGYRYLTLFNDGRIETVVHRVDDIEFTVDYSIKGY